MNLADALRDAAAALTANDLARVEALCGPILNTYPAHPEALDMLAAGLMPAQLHFGLHTLRGLGLLPRGILDIGAYEGGFAQMAKHFFPETRVLMVEAQPGKEQILKSLAARLSGVDYRMALLGSENRDDVAFGLVNPTGNTSGSSLYDEQTSFSREALLLPMRTLDTILAELPVGNFDMLKLDVQGAELDVLRGASRTLAWIEVIVIELSLLEYNKGAPLMAEVVARLDSLGFALFDWFPVSRLPSGVLLQADGIFLRRDSKLWPKAPFL